ncbi:MAG: SHOCT domain-containing protein [Spirochaetota bacterium]
MMILVLLLVAFGVYLFVRNQREPGHRAVPIDREDSLDILNRRFAKGEISGEEYNRMKRDLGL